MTATVLRLVIDNSAETELEEAQRVCRKLTDVDRDPATRSGTQLVSPGCVLGCRTCFRACAVNRIMLDWWTAELARLQQGGLVA